MSLFKKAAKSATKKVFTPTPGLRNVIRTAKSLPSQASAFGQRAAQVAAVRSRAVARRTLPDALAAAKSRAAKTYNPVTGPLGAAKSATKKVFTPTPGLRNVIRAAKTYNPVTGPLGAIKKVTKALKPKPHKRGRR